MKLESLAIPGVRLLYSDPREDKRGCFVKMYDQEVFADSGLCTEWAQTAWCSNRCRGTLRGLHYQASPHAETKLVRCTRGAIWDVVVDMRPDSPTVRRWIAVELRADSTCSLYIPSGCAHGYQALEDDSEVYYQISARYFAELQRGVRWDDPGLAIAWPIPDAVSVSRRDAGLPDLAECFAGGGGGSSEK